MLRDIRQRCHGAFASDIDLHAFEMPNITAASHRSARKPFAPDRQTCRTCKPFVRPSHSTILRRSSITRPPAWPLISTGYPMRRNTPIFELPKRGGGKRKITAPSEKLALVQRRLANLLADCLEEIKRTIRNGNRLRTASSGIALLSRTQHFISDGATS